MTSTAAAAVASGPGWHVERRDLADTGLQVRERGAGRPLLYLHAEHFQDAAQPFLDGLADRFRAIAPRHPGFDGTAPPADFRTVGDLACLYLDLLEDLDLRESVLVGTSFGGWIALELAVRDCSRIGRLVLVNPVGVRFGGREDREFADLFAADEATQRRLLFADPARHAPDFATLDDAAMETIAREREYAAWYGWSPYMHDPRLGRWLHRVRVPALVLSGAADGYVPPSNGAMLAAHLPDARHEVLDGAGHCPQIECPDALAATVAAFAGEGEGV